MFRPPIFPFLIGALSLIAAHAPAQGGQIGGWHRPLWESEWDDQASPAIDVVGDVTGDGVGDFIEYRNGKFHVVNGGDGSTWYESVAELGAANLVVVRAVDLDGDGTQEVIAGFPYATRSQTGSLEVGRIVVIEGGTAAPLWEVWGDASLMRLGGSFFLADVTGDGLPDVGTANYQQHRSVFRGLDGQRVWSVLDPQQGTLQAGGDSNADGIPDLLMDQGDGDALVDGATGSLLWATSRGFENYFWDAKVIPFDITGDGLSDLIVCEPLAKANGKGWISARSGADGSLLWRRKGSHRDDYLGMNASLEDLTGDGVPELISNSTDDFAVAPATIYVLDVVTGERIWRYEWADQYKGRFPLLREDVNQDGIPDFILTELDVRTNTSAVVALDARTGGALWPEYLPRVEGWFRRLKTADLNQDGVPDFIAAGRLGGHGVDGMVLAFSGVDGRVLWQQEGVPGHDIGRGLAVQVLQTGEVDVYSVALPGSNEVASLIAWNGRTGEEKWRVDWPATGYPQVKLDLIDLNYDGVPELLVYPDRNENNERDFIHLFDTANQGNLIWSAEDVRLQGSFYTEDYFGALGDADGDSWLDFVFYGRANSGSKLVGLSGRMGTWTAGLRMQTESVSASVGGSNELRVDADVDRGNKKYLLLFSENGPGETTLGSLTLPLAPGLWLSRSAIGIFPPGVFSAPTGRLDQDGKANIQVQIPAGALSAWVGRELSFCVAVKTYAQGGPDWTTGFASMRILP